MYKKGLIPHKYIITVHISDLSSGSVALGLCIRNYYLKSAYGPMISHCTLKTVEVHNLLYMIFLSFTFLFHFVTFIILFIYYIYSLANCTLILAGDMMMGCLH